MKTTETPEEARARWQREAQERVAFEKTHHDQWIAEFLASPPLVPRTKDEGLAATKILNRYLVAIHKQKKGEPCVNALDPFLAPARAGLIADVHFHMNLAVVLTSVGRLDEAMEFVERTLAFRDANYSPDTVQSAFATTQLAERPEFLALFERSKVPVADRLVDELEISVESANVLAEKSIRTVGELMKVGLAGFSKRVADDLSRALATVVSKG